MTEIELLGGDKFPEGYVVMGIGQIKIGDAVQKVADISAKNQKAAQKIGKMFKSCYVFVDLGQVIKKSPDPGLIWVYAMRRLDQILGENPNKKE